MSLNVWHCRDAFYSQIWTKSHCSAIHSDGSIQCRGGPLENPATSNKRPTKSCGVAFSSSPFKSQISKHGAGDKTTHLTSYSDLQRSGLATLWRAPAAATPKCGGRRCQQPPIAERESPRQAHASIEPWNRGTNAPHTPPETPPVSNHRLRRIFPKEHFDE